MIFHFRCNICKIFAEGNFLSRNMSLVLEPPLLPRDIHGAPPEGFLTKLSEVIGSFTTLRKMALFWCKIVAEVSGLLEILSGDLTHGKDYISFTNLK